MVIQQQQLSRPTPPFAPVDARCAFRTMKVNLHSPLLIRWHKNESPGALFVTLMMGKGNTPVLGSERVHDFRETKSGNRAANSQRFSNARA